MLKELEEFLARTPLYISLSADLRKGKRRHVPQGHAVEPAVIEKLTEEQQRTLCTFLESPDSLAGFHLDHLGEVAGVALDVLASVWELHVLGSDTEHQARRQQAEEMFCFHALSAELDSIKYKRERDLADAKQRAQEELEKIRRQTAEDLKRVEKGPQPAAPPILPSNFSLVASLLEEVGVGPDVSGSLARGFDRGVDYLLGAFKFTRTVGGYVLRRERRRAQEHLETVELLDSIFKVSERRVAVGMFDEEEDGDDEYADFSNEDLERHLKGIREEQAARADVVGGKGGSDVDLPGILLSLLGSKAATIGQALVPDEVQGVRSDGKPFNDIDKARACKDQAEMAARRALIVRLGKAAERALEGKYSDEEVRQLIVSAEAALSDWHFNIATINPDPAVNLLHERVKTLKGIHGIASAKHAAADMKAQLQQVTDAVNTLAAMNAERKQPEAPADPGSTPTPEGPVYGDTTFDTSHRYGNPQDID